jgi:hypothetical protein
MKTYVDLYRIYGPNLATIKQTLDIGTVQIDKKSIYLQRHSDRVLNECNDDPSKALERLTREYANHVGTMGIEYDETAITFFLVDELTRCNVFPNKSN